MYKRVVCRFQWGRPSLLVAFADKIKLFYYDRDPLFDLIFDLSATFIQQLLANRKKVTRRMKLIMGTAFLAYKRDSFIMKLFPFVCEKRFIDLAPFGIFDDSRFFVCVRVGDHSQLFALGDGNNYHPLGAHNSIYQCARGMVRRYGPAAD
jgi:hypothetical protein